MKFLHYELDLRQNDCVKVTLDKQANVQLVDSANFQNYKNRRRYKYYGGLATKSPVTLSPPHSGKWHLVIDTGGRGSVNVSVNVI